VDQSKLLHIEGRAHVEEGREDLCNPRSRLIASIAYSPERYGDGVLRPAQSILDHGQAPPVACTAHVVLTAPNIASYYSTLFGGLRRPPPEQDPLGHGQVSCSSNPPAPAAQTRRQAKPAQLEIWIVN
jgi:hypothetical protein